MTVEQEHKIIKATVRRHDPRTMILRISVGEGEINGEKFDIGTNASDGSPVWYFHNEKRYYTVSLKALTDEVMDFRDSLGLIKEEKVSQ